MSRTVPDPPSPDELRAALDSVYGFNGFRPQQEAVIRAILSRHDTFVRFPTGSGKSVLYTLPALLSPGLAVVVSPLLSLIQDQVLALTQAPCGGIPAAHITSALAPGVLESVYADLESDHPQIKLLFVTPEQADKSNRFRRALSSLHQRRLVSFVAFDEAHCVSSWGHDFRASFLEVGAAVKELCPGAPIAAFTATATRRVMNDVRSLLRMRPDTQCFTASFNRPNLRFAVLDKPRPSTLAMVWAAKFVAHAHPGETGIVYCLTRKDAEMMAEALYYHGIAADYYHAGMSPTQRETVQIAWRQSVVRVVAATIAYGMGIDHPNVRFVVHLTLPKSVESYHQEAGRAGRDGKVADCIILFNPSDTNRVRKLITDDPGKTAAQRRHLSELLDDAADYCSTKEGCRRKRLVAHFDEHLPESACGGTCDACGWVPAVPDDAPKVTAAMMKTRPSKARAKGGGGGIGAGSRRGGKARGRGGWRGRGFGRKKR